MAWTDEDKQKQEAKLEEAHKALSKLVEDHPEAMEAVTKWFNDYSSAGLRSLARLVKSGEVTG